MKIYTLVGKSGTGKSFHAMFLCNRYGIESIIDDGLFIYKKTIVAGESAKRSKTKIGAVRTALFTNQNHCDSVRKEIQRRRPSSILILGTSDGMVEKIIGRLELLKDNPDKEVTRINIEDITTPEERETAREQRQVLGKHVIPAPTPQLKTNFAGYFMDPLRIFRGKDQGAASERTVVRPSYSYMGEYFILDKVVTDIVLNVASEIEGLGRVIYIGHNPSPEAYELYLVIKIKRGHQIWGTADELREKVGEMVERMTAFNVTRIDVEVRNLS